MRCRCRRAGSPLTDRWPGAEPPFSGDQGGWRIASPEMLPGGEALPCLRCSRAALTCEEQGEAGEHHVEDYNGRIYENGKAVCCTYFCSRLPAFCCNGSSAGRRKAWDIRLMKRVGAKKARVAVAHRHRCLGTIGLATRWPGRPASLDRHANIGSTDCEVTAMVPRITPAPTRRGMPEQMRFPSC